MTFEEFQKLVRPGTIVPIYRQMNADFITPVMAYLKLRDSQCFSFILESVVKGEHLGRYSFIGCAPFQILSATQGQVEIHHGNSPQLQEPNFFDSLHARLKRYRAVRVDRLPRFTGGAVGYIGYDMIRFIEHLPTSNPDPIGIADALLGFYTDLVAFDHLKNQVILIANVLIDNKSHLPSLYHEAHIRLERMREKLNRPMSVAQKFQADLTEIRCNFNREDFESAVRRAKTHILAGDIFQVVISQRFQAAYTGDVFQVYRALRNINPSPYLFYLDFLDFQLIGSSPEPLVRLENGELEIVPIAGTRPRGQTEEQDAHHARSLLNDPKELAEHVMLVDLARNDVGRVALPGTVKVNDFQTIERYSHVMHIISRVNGKLKPSYSAVDAFKAAFPAGTVSGAPKIQAMEIIDDLEPEKRGFYAGAIGYFDYNGNMDMCIAIRTMLAKDGTIHWQAGAGIVADSDPAKEYQETLNKGQALKKAIEQATGGIDDFVYR